MKRVLFLSSVLFTACTQIDESTSSLDAPVSDTGSISVDKPWQRDGGAEPEAKPDLSISRQLDSADVTPIVKPPLDALSSETTPASFDCRTTSMVWRNADGTELRRDYNCASGRPSASGFCYDFTEDRCDGYRCLGGSAGDEIGPACYTSQQCAAACAGTCVSIASARNHCAELDGGIRPDGPPVSLPEPIHCEQTSMVWRNADGTELRRDYNCASGRLSASGFCYDFVEDRCDGYRCLGGPAGDEIDPACYAPQQCPEACAGTCVHIPRARTRCATVDGGARPDGPQVSLPEPILCEQTSMVWRRDDGAELRRDYNCASGRTSASGFCYDFVEDHCEGYRCLGGSAGDEIGPTCYAPQQCSEACAGTCVHIPRARTQCAIVDGGARPERG